MIHDKPIEYLRELHNAYFTLGYLNTDINTKFALISLICHLVVTVRKKKPHITHYEVIKSIIKDKVPDNFCRSLSVICEDFAYGCSEFPTFGLENKAIPAKIYEILTNRTPF